MFPRKTNARVLLTTLVVGFVIMSGFSLTASATEPIELDPDGLRTEPIDVNPDGLKTEPIDINPDGLKLGLR